MMRRGKECVSACRSQIFAGGLLLTFACSVMAASPVGLSQETKTRYGLQRQEIDFSAGLSNSDNIGRDRGEQSGTFTTAGVITNIVGESKRFAWSLKGLMDYYSYNDRRFDDEAVGNVVGQAAMDLFEDRLTWDLIGNYGQLRRNSFAAESPDNRESVSSIETGPALTLPISAVMVFSARGRFGQRQSGGEGAVDSQLTSLETGFSRYLDPYKQLGVFVSRREVEFDDGQVPGYDVESAFLRYQQELRAGSVSFELGSNTLERENAASDSGLFTRLNFNTQIGSRSSLNVYAIRDFQDSAYSLRDGLNPTNGSSGRQTALTSDPIERRGFGIDAAFRASRLSVEASIETTNERYKSDQQLDRDTMNYGLSIAREILPNLRAGASIRHRTEEFEGQIDSAKELSGKLNLRYRLSRTLDLETAFLRWNREGGQNSDGELNETQWLLTLHYTPWTRRG